MTIKALKLISGEELVGEILHEEPGVEITVKNPLAIMMQRTQTGDLTVGFVPFAPYLGRNVTLTFSQDRLVFVQEVDDNMRNQYNAIYGGITIPPKQILVE